MSAYRKGYRAEDIASDYMLQTYGAKCMRSGGSHGTADLICGNGKCVYVVQVKSGTHLPYISWAELEDYAKLFLGKPLLLFKPDYRRILEAHCQDDLVRIRAYLKNMRDNPYAMRKM